MKVNLVSLYQQGGTYSPPYVVYQPIPHADQRTGAVSSSSSSESKDLTDKDLLQVLKDMDGLPSDMALITGKLRNFYLSQSTTPGTSLRSQTSNIAARYIKILNQIKVAKFNKNEYDNAYEQVAKNGGINEVAINDRGQFVCTNSEGDFKFMTPEELKRSFENDEGYVPMTNSELLYYRANDVSLANNNRILSVVQNGIGMETVTELIQKALMSLASSQTSKEGYVSTQAGELLQGVEDFQKAVEQASGRKYDGTVDDLYKYKYLTKDQKDQAERAFAYIYSMLPANAKALLKAKSDLTEEGAQQLVQTLVASKMDTKQDFGLDLVGGVSNTTTKNAPVSSDQNLKETQIIQMLRGQGGDWSTMTIDRSDGIEMTVDGQAYYNLRNSLDNKPIGGTSMLDMMKQTGILDNSKRNAITFGDQPLTTEALGNIAYTGTGVLRVNLPCNPDGSVNLKVLQQYEDAEAKIDSLGHTPTAEEMRSIYEESDIADLLTAEGKPNPSKFGAFLITDGLTTDRLAGIQQTKFCRELSRTEARTAVPIIQKCLTEGNGKGTAPDIDRKNALSIGDMFSTWYEHLYKGVVFIPVNVDMISAGISGKQYPGVYTEANALEKLYQDAPKRRTFNTASADVLGL